MDERVDQSQLHVTLVVMALLLAVVVAVPLVGVFLVVGVPWWLGLAAGLVAGGLIVAYWHRTADRRVLNSFVAGSASPRGTARVENLVAGLSLSIGNAEPTMLVIADEARNALAVSRGDRQTVVFTNALVDDLDRIQLEGVVAEVLVRLKSGEAELGTITASVVGLPLLNSPLAPLTRKLAAWLLRRNLDEHRDVLADQRAVAVTRYPPGLSAGLDLIGGGPITPAAATPGADHLWMVSPPRLESVVPTAPLDWRVEALLEI